MITDKSWIDASIELPGDDKQGDHLLLCKRNKKHPKWKTIRQGHWECGKFYIDGGMYEDDYISHWQTLVKP
ncbi:hypothetical protein [Leeuwenhoekiella sp. MAR_2009_132]|uniref:hypothetical protein n=1 Tax=Leeuwenhoekiella sp. MAR_2009_132 TaxID=1392489 RepID=UPI00048CA831|nr:hypothetical protein [Leeuwenhoekiella sp. MAR_2009_132]